MSAILLPSPNRSIGRSIARALALAGVVALALGLSRPGYALDRDNYRLGAGDRVKVEVYSEPEASTEATIEEDGKINYPLIGPVEVAGLTLRGLEQTITTRLADGYILHASVRATIVSFRSIYLVGQVVRAGAYPYVEGLTVEKALALGGGMTALGSSRYITIRHEGPQDGPKASKRESATLQTTVQPGDTIVVEQGLF